MRAFSNDPVARRRREPGLSAPASHRRASLPRHLTRSREEGIRKEIHRRSGEALVRKSRPRRVVARHSSQHASQQGRPLEHPPAARSLPVRRLSRDHQEKIRLVLGDPFSAENREPTAENFPERTTENQWPRTLYPEKTYAGGGGVLSRAGGSGSGRTASLKFLSP